MLVPRAHSVTIEIRNQKESRVIETRTTRNPFCEEVNISSARIPASHGPDYDGPQSVGHSHPGAALASGQSRCTSQICTT
jgi:hypothetical protein